MLKNRRMVFSFLPIFLVLIFAGFLRLPTFFLAHTNFDEVAYLSLALKLDKYGFKNFEKHFDLHYIEIVKNDYFRTPVITDKSVGNILIGSKVNYEYKAPTHRPPGFSFLLMLSHKIFSAKSHYFTSNINFNPYLYLQFYACFVPFLFSLLAIYFTFLLGKMLFSEEVGLYAALFLSLNPTELFVSHKIWAETMLTLFTVLTVLFYFLSQRKNKLIYSFLSGASAGLAVLSKLSGGFIIISILSYHLWLNRLNLLKVKKFLKIVFDLKIIIFLSVFILTTGPWLFIYKKHQGLGMPSVAPSLNSITPWLQFIGHRPWYVYLVNIPCQFPIFFTFYLSFFMIFMNKEKRDEILFLIFWFLIAFLIMAFKVWHKEDRYMMPAYPAITMLSSYVLLKIKLFLNRINPYFGEIAITCFIILTSSWALKLSVPLILSRNDLFAFPL